MVNKATNNKSKNNIRNKSEEYKNALYKRHETILDVIYYIGNGIMLKDQIKAIISVLQPLNKNINESIKELIEEGFLKEKQVLTSDKYSVYLTKYPKSKIEGKNSRDVTSVKPTQEKVLNSLLRTEYFIQNLLVNIKNRKIVINNIREVLDRICNTVLNGKSQANDSYSSFYNKINKFGLSTYLTEDFKVDREVIYLEKLQFINKISRELKEIPESYLVSKGILEQEKIRILSGNTVEDKYFFNFNNMLHRGFDFEKLTLNIVEGQEYNNELVVKIVYLDMTDNVNVDKLYKNIGFIYKMLNRYIENDLHIKVEVDVYMWSKPRVNEMELKEKERVKSFGLNNYKQYPRGLNGLQNGGVRDDELKNITVKYKSLSITDKYNIKQT